MFWGVFKRLAGSCRVSRGRSAPPSAEPLGPHGPAWRSLGGCWQPSPGAWPFQVIDQRSERHFLRGDLCRPAGGRSAAEAGSPNKSRRWSGRIKAFADALSIFRRCSVRVCENSSFWGAAALRLTLEIEMSQWIWSVGCQGTQIDSEGIASDYNRDFLFSPECHAYPCLIALIIYISIHQDGRQFRRSSSYDNYWLYFQCKCLGFFLFRRPKNVFLVQILSHKVERKSFFLCYTIRKHLIVAVKQNDLAPQTRVLAEATFGRSFSSPFIKKIQVFWQQRKKPPFHFHLP